MKVRLSVEYQVDEKNPDLEKLATRLIREEADAFTDAVKRALVEAGAEVTSFQASYG